MDLLSSLVVYGPLGIWALAASVALVAKDKELGRQRDACAADAAALNEAHAAKIDALIKEHGAAIAAATAAFGATLREQSERYERQLAEGTQRSFTIVTTLSDKMSALADSLTRNRR